MNTSNTQLKNNIMRRVYIVFYLRRALSPFALKSYAALILAWVLTRMVYISAVIHNAPNVSSPWAFVSFVLNAFLHTQFLVQATVSVVVLLLGWGVVDLATRGRQALLSPAF